MTLLNRTVQVLLIAGVLFSSCRQVEEEVPVRFTGQALGTAYSISYFDSQRRNFKEEIDSLFKEFNSVMSIYDKNSLLSEVNSKKETFVDNLWFLEVYRTSKDIYNNTNGKFDPTVGILVNAWGFGAGKKMEVTPDVVDSLLVFVGFDKISLQEAARPKEENSFLLKKKDERIQLDFNAIAKGFSADVVADFLNSKGINSYLIEVGGEIISKGKKPDGSYWRVGIEKPAEHALQKQEVFQVIKLHNMALATSGDYRRYYEKDGKRYSHTINPHTGYPVENNLLSVTVLANTSMLADAYATAFMVMGVEKSLAYTGQTEGLEVFMIYEDDSQDLQTISSDGLKDLME